MFSWIYKSMAPFRQYPSPVWAVAAASLMMASVACAAADVPVTETGAVRNAPHTEAKKSSGVDSREKWYRKKRAARRSGLDEKIIVHADSRNVSELIDFLAPPSWRVQYDVDAASLNREMVFHAETTRKRALDELCLSLELKGIFYPQRRLILIVDGVQR